jgi:hypothetical protein
MILNDSKWGFETAYNFETPPWSCSCLCRLVRWMCFPVKEWNPNFPNFTEKGINNDHDLYVSDIMKRVANGVRQERVDEGIRKWTRSNLMLQDRSMEGDLVQVIGEILGSTNSWGALRRLPFRDHGRQRGFVGRAAEAGSLRQGVQWPSKDVDYRKQG